ncbi:hypothetical protein IV102_08700 [bacterium]|nr:hypothetical protein [bacterium]
MRKILIVLGLLVVLVAVGLLIFLKKNQVALSSAEIEKMASDMLAGAKPPTGLKGVLGLHLEGLEVVIFAPSLPKAEPSNLTGSDLRIIVAKPTAEKAPTPQEIGAKIDAAQKRKAEQMDALRKGPLMLKVGGKPYPGLESQLALKSDGRKLRENMTIVLADKKPVVVLMLGPEESFNTAARDEFLAALAAPTQPHGDLPRVPSGLLQRPLRRPGPPGHHPVGLPSPSL